MITYILKFECVYGLNPVLAGGILPPWHRAAAGCPSTAWGGLRDLLRTLFGSFRTSMLAAPAGLTTFWPIQLFFSA